MRCGDCVSPRLRMRWWHCAWHKCPSNLCLGRAGRFWPLIENSTVFHIPRKRTGCSKWSQPVDPLVERCPDAWIERPPPRHICAQTPAMSFDPAILGLRDFSTNEIGGRQCCACPPVFGRQSYRNLHGESRDDVLKIIHDRQTSRRGTRSGDISRRIIPARVSVPRGGQRHDAQPCRALLQKRSHPESSNGRQGHAGRPRTSARRV